MAELEYGGGKPGLLSMLNQPVSPGMMSLGEYNELDPMTLQWAGNQAALPASMNIANPYGGRTMGQVVDQNGAPPVGVGGGSGEAPSQTTAQWSNAPATNEQVSAAIQRGGKYQPDYARRIMSSGPEGGWFAYPGARGATESLIPWGYHSDPRENPAPGLLGMSTNNWRLLPQGYQNPGFNMRSGHILKRFYEDKPWTYQTDRGADAPWGIGGPGHGFPFSHGSSNQRGYYFPGQIEPELSEGGPGTT